MYLTMMMIDTRNLNTQTIYPSCVHYTGEGWISFRRKAPAAIKWRIDIDSRTHLILYYYKIMRKNRDGEAQLNLQLLSNIPSGPTAAAMETKIASKDRVNVYYTFVSMMVIGRRVLYLSIYLSVLLKHLNWMAMRCSGWSQKVSIGAHGLIYVGD